MTAPGSTATYGAPSDARSGDAVITIEGVSKVFSVKGAAPFEALKDINLTIRPGRFVCFVGPSGCGKSTLLNMIAGLVGPTSGRVLYRGRPLRGINGRVGYITQRDNLLPWRTLERNVGLALELQHMRRADRRRRVSEILERVELGPFSHLYPSQMSGGMRKRATLARTLIYEPETILMDEPFAAVDAILRLSLHEMLMRIWEREGATVVFVTHDLEEAMVLGDEIVVFGKNPGRIVHVEEVSFPRPRHVLELRSQPEFGRTWSRLWSYLESAQGGILAGTG